MKTTLLRLLTSVFCLFLGFHCTKPDSKAIAADTIDYSHFIKQGDSLVNAMREYRYKLHNLYILQKGDIVMLLETYFTACDCDSIRERDESYTSKRINCQRLSVLENGKLLFRRYHDVPSLKKDFCGCKAASVLENIIYLFGTFEDSTGAKYFAIRGKGRREGEEETSSYRAVINAKGEFIYKRYGLYGQDYEKIGGRLDSLALQLGIDYEALDRDDYPYIFL